ncbi:peroxiredoxin 1 [Drosophila pseudoobscura]|uniref:thioredoxin-dependent peroxiredoxin n=1 Tax=Drosophila pseudoobscura pseudoobscura TaxID=46245 RepID=B5DRU1_DROPS|nr:peroxiredoxin 1 [Drosophila pseudoobscura]
MLTMPSLRQMAPEFQTIAVVAGGIRDLSLSDLRGRYVLLVFYPADFSYVCPTELQAFSDRALEFRNVGCEVMACSTDSHFVHCAWIAQPRKKGGLGELDIPLLSDKSMKIAKDYGVLDEKTGLALRATFIIDRDGLVRQITVNDNGVGRSVDEALRLVQALQFSDEFGMVCPVNWKKGTKGMKPDESGKEEYFKNST